MELILQGKGIKNLNCKASYDHYRSIAQFKMYSNIHDVGLLRLKHKFILDNYILSEE